MKFHIRAAAFTLPLLLLATPAHAQGNQAQELSNCAGAVASLARLDPINYPRGASGDWAPVLGAILEQLNRQEGVEGMTGRYAASAARQFWDEQPRAQREAAANECRDRYAS
jgi:hypothetical protein